MIHAHELAFLVVRQLVVHRTIALGDAFEAVVEIDKDLVQGQVGCHHHARTVKGLGMVDIAALFRDEGKDIADGSGGNVQGGLDRRLVNGSISEGSGRFIGLCTSSSVPSLRITL
jgi:hypothetical protein